MKPRWAHLPTISEYDRNSILLVFGNRPEFDELQAKRFDNIVGGLAWFAKVRDDRLIYGLPLPKTHSPRQRHLD